MKTQVVRGTERSTNKAYGNSILALRKQNSYDGS